MPNLFGYIQIGSKLLELLALYRVKAARSIRGWDLI